MEDGYNLWHLFKKKLIKLLKEDTKGLLQSWGSNADRTTYYFKNLLPKIASEMGYLFRSEKPLRVDGLFYKIGSQLTPIPYIVIESENNIHSSSEEIEKLCLISAPLKILFVVYEWNEEISKKIAGENWEYIIDDFAEAGQLTGITAIIIACWDESLKLYSLVYDNSHNYLEQNELLLDLKI